MNVLYYIKKNIYIGITAIYITLIFASCKKNDPISMRWDLTGCYNPWDESFVLDTFSYEKYHQGIYDFLTTEGLEVNYVTSEFDSSKLELCYACHCKTGTVIIINIPRKHRIKLKNLAPNNQFDLYFY